MWCGDLGFCPFNTVITQMALSFMDNAFSLQKNFIPKRMEKHTYQMNDINADITSFDTLNSYQQNIPWNISRALVIDNFMPVRILNIHSFATNLCRL